MSHYNLDLKITLLSCPRSNKTTSFCSTWLRFSNPSQATNLTIPSGQSTEEIANALKEENEWNEFNDGPAPVELDYITPWHWYTQYWSTCALRRQSADLNGLEFREICDYEFQDDETIYTGHFLDLY